ncbi:hypothetical protein EAM_1425 [Erwinia amylovora ATCC 49946]|nr:hypothetical protein EAM_1425 [Erwinia amylovora ATCC 49946]
MVIYLYQCRQDSATVEVIHSIHRKHGLPRYLSVKNHRWRSFRATSAATLLKSINFHNDIRFITLTNQR